MLGVLMSHRFETCINTKAGRPASARSVLIHSSISEEAEDCAGKGVTMNSNADSDVVSAINAIV